MQGAPSGVALATLDLSIGQFNRQALANRDATYQTSATTVAAAGQDVARLEDVGDGNGALHLFEGVHYTIPARSNLDAAWSILNSAVLTANAATAPDGTMTAAQVDFGTLHTSAVSQTLTGSNVTSSVTGTHRVWVRGAVGGESFRFWYADKDGANQVSADQTLTTGWQWFEYKIGTGAGAGNPVERIRNRAAGGAQTIYVWQMNFVDTPWMGSGINANVAAQKGAVNEDSRVFLAAQIPLWVREGVWSDQVYTQFASAEIASGDEFWLYSWGSDQDGIRIRHTGSDVRIELVGGGSVLASSAALTFAAGAQLDCTFDLAAGIVTVNTVAGATGSAVVFPGGVVMRAGGIVTGHNELFGSLRGPHQVAA